MDRNTQFRSIEDKKNPMTDINIELKPGAYVCVEGITMHSVDKIADRFIDAGCPVPTGWQHNRGLIQDGVLKHVCWDKQHGLCASTLAHIEYGMGATFEVAASAVLCTYASAEQLTVKGAGVDEMVASLPPHMQICTVREVCQHLYSAGYRKHPKGQK